MERVSRLYKANTGVGCDGFHTKVLLDLTKETRREIVEFLEKVEQSGNWTIPKNVTSERPTSLIPTLIRWWEALRALEVAKNIVWIGTLLTGEMEEPSKTVWEILLEMERLNGKAKDEGQGALALVLDLAKAFERSVFLLCGPGQRTSASQARYCECCARILSTGGECSSKDVRRNRSRPSRPSCQGSSGVVCFCVLYCKMRWVRSQEFTLL